MSRRPAAQQKRPFRIKIMAPDTELRVSDCGRTAALVGARLRQDGGRWGSRVRGVHTFPRKRWD